MSYLKSNCLLYKWVFPLIPIILLLSWYIKFLLKETCCHISALVSTAPYKLCYYAECEIINFKNGSVKHPLGRGITHAAIYSCDGSRGYFIPKGVIPIRVCTTQGWTGSDKDIYCDSKFFVSMYKTLHRK